jgi:hypothetical protein
MKLIINESQYNLIESLVFEEKYQNLIKDIDKNKKITIFDKNNNTLSFNVIFNDNGQLYLRSLDNNIYKNDIFFITVTDLVNDNLSFKRVNIPSEFRDEQNVNKLLSAVIKSSPVKDWKKSSFKNIQRMKMGDDEVDIEKDDADTEELKSYKKVDDVSELVGEFNSFKEDDSIKFKIFGGGEIIMKVISKESNNLLLNLVSTSGKGDNYKKVFADSDIIFDVSDKNISQHISSDSDEDVDSYINIRVSKSLGGETGKGSVKSKPILIKYISDFESVEKKGEKKPEAKKKKPKAEDIDDMTPEDITDLVLSNPTFRNAFMSKPSFWDAFLGKKPKGILAAKAILRNVADTSLPTSGKEKTLSDTFKQNQIYLIQLVDEDFNKDGVSLTVYEDYRVKADKRTKISGESIVLLKGKNVAFKVNKLTDGPRNIYRVTVITTDKDGSQRTENRAAKIKEGF